MTRRSRRQKAAGRHENWLQLALTMHPNRWFQLAPISIERSTTAVVDYGTGYTFFRYRSPFHQFLLND